MRRWRIESVSWRLTPHGVSGLKLEKFKYGCSFLRLTPHGVSGLKFLRLHLAAQPPSSHPAWGEWIEISPAGPCGTRHRSHPAWGEWIEIERSRGQPAQMPSHPAWGEWIEIKHLHQRTADQERLTPHGVSGLKYLGGTAYMIEIRVSPRMG